MTGPFLTIIIIMKASTTGGLEQIYEVRSICLCRVILYTKYEVYVTSFVLLYIHMIYR